jgi:hypothetical protein
MVNPLNVQMTPSDNIDACGSVENLHQHTAIQSGLSCHCNGGVVRPDIERAWIFRVADALR